MIENIGSIKATTGEELLRMWCVTVPSGKRTIYKHCHTNFEIGLVISGSGIYRTEKKKYKFSKGDVIVFSSNEQHCIEEIFEDGLKLLNMHFVPRYLRNTTHDEFTEKNINFCFTHGKKFENVISGDKGEKISFLIKNIREELEEKSSEYRVMIKSLVNQITVNLIRDFDYSDENIAYNIKNLHGIRRAMNYIDDNISGELTLNAIADIAGLTPNYFSALFKKVNNISPWDYINSKRVDMAIGYIMDKENSDTLLSIATKCGFNNTANFNKTFKHITGMTPTQYRSSGDVILNIS